MTALAMIGPARWAFLLDISVVTGVLANAMNQLAAQPSASAEVVLAPGTQP